MGDERAYVEEFLAWVRDTYGPGVAEGCEAEIGGRETVTEAVLSDVLETVLSRGKDEDRAMARSFGAMRFNSE